MAQAIKAMRGTYFITKICVSWMANKNNIIVPTCPGMQEAILEETKFLV